MNNKKKAEKVIKMLEESYPDAQCGLEAEKDPFKLLVMAVLSAQTTDKIVNKVAKTLFIRFPTPESIAYSEPGELKQEIRSIGLYNSKSKNLRLACRRLVEVYGSVLPSDMDELLTLAGVGRKVANLIRGDLFGLGGIVADTHCIRICGRLGFVESKNPIVVERTMDALIPKEAQSDFCHRIVLFGREICNAKKPLCERCFLKEYCCYIKSS
ncbi:MAG: endonuclease III [Eubacteriales bacterium]|nr:endonuclease III [Eubacteriales bacterium]MDD4422507.1 endonuclease III [Eubacteriales bacterium]HBR30635.1 endonuclease III [Clostridiales bacterium]